MGKNTMKKKKTHKKSKSRSRSKDDKKKQSPSVVEEKSSEKIRPRKSKFDLKPDVKVESVNDTLV